jgi:hypothetical protein
MRVPMILEFDALNPVGALEDVKLVMGYRIELDGITRVVVLTLLDVEDVVIDAPTVTIVCVLWIVIVVSLEADEARVEGEL